MKPALLIIDMQKAYFDLPQARTSMEWAKTFIQQAVETFHKAKRPVIFIQIDSAGDGPGSPGFDLIEGLGRTETDIVMTKAYKNSFWKTSLEDRLKELNCDFVVIAGFAAGQCVNMTYGGAQERNFGAALLQHGVAGWKDRHIEVTYEQCSLISTTVLEAVLGASP